MFSSRRNFISGGMAMAGCLGAAEPDERAPLNIGVVNIRTCFEKEKYPRMAEALDDLGKLRDQLSKEATDLQKAISALADKMENLPRNAELYVELVRRRAHAEYDLKLLQEVARRRVRDRLSDLESRVFSDIRRVVAQVARNQNLDLILRVDEPRLQEEDAEAPQRNASRDVLFHRDALDVTPQVLARLNADWAAAWTCAVCRRKVADEKCPDCGAKKP